MMRMSGSCHRLRGGGSLSNFLVSYFEHSRAIAALRDLDFSGCSIMFAFTNCSSDVKLMAGRLYFRDNMGWRWRVDEGSRR